MATPAAPTAFSPLQKQRLALSPALPRVLQRAADHVFVITETHKDVHVAGVSAAADAEKIAALFPRTISQPPVAVSVRPAAAAAALAAGERAVAPRTLRIGCVLSGGQAPGGHNVIAGLYDGIKAMSPESVLYGFRDGPRGLFTGNYIVVDDAFMNAYRNMGGFDMIGSGRDKIETPEQFAGCVEVATRMNLDGVVIIGGDDSNTNAALLAEHFAREGVRTSVIGCPKTIDGDLKVPDMVDISFGELIGNVCVDAASSGKYWHLIRLMGRAASNITLECALSTRPNIALLGEEVAARAQNLASIARECATIVAERARAGRNYGVMLVPEGLVEFVPEMNALLKEVNELLAGGTTATVGGVAAALSANNAALFAYLPAGIRAQLLAERDPHGNVQVSLIETERLLAELIAAELARMRARGECPETAVFSPQCSFFGYEARCALPSDFDTAYCYALGTNAAVLVAAGATALMSSVTNLAAAVSEWSCAGAPLMRMMTVERRKGKDKPVIRKALVELDGAPFRTFAAARGAWALNDAYMSPGPIQLSDGASTQVELCHTLALELQDRVAVAAGTAVHTHAPSLSAATASLSAAAGDPSAGYAALVSALLSDEDVSAHDVQRLHMFRVTRGISDEEHLRVCASVGIDEAAWARIVAKARAQEAASAAAH